MLPFVQRRSEPRVIDPDTFEHSRNRIEREEVPRSGKAQARGVARLHLRMPGAGIAHSFAGKAEPRFVDRLAEVGRESRRARHAAKRGIVGFHSFALGVLPALDHRASHDGS
jgi:hypothetical protein